MHGAGVDLKKEMINAERAVFMNENQIKYKIINELRL